MRRDGSVLARPGSRGSELDGSHLCLREPAFRVVTQPALGLQVGVQARLVASQGLDLALEVLYFALAAARDVLGFVHATVCAQRCFQLRRPLLTVRELCTQLCGGRFSCLQCIEMDYES